MPLQQTSGAASYDAFGGGVAAVPNYIEDVFSTWLYTGNGSTQTINNGIDLAGEGGMTWVKSRSAAVGHVLVDTVRGAAKYLSSNTTNQQFTNADTISAFTSSGFTVGNDNDTNSSGATYASGTFREQPKFFDVVTYTGNGGVQNIAHNLGSAPGAMLIKRTSSDLAWYCYHRSLGNSATIVLNSSNAQVTGSAIWNNTDPTSTQFTVGNSINNTSGETYVAYLFAHNAGGFGLSGTDNVISCGSFTGSTTVELGFEPQWILRKPIDAVGDWTIVDVTRGATVNSGGGAGDASNLFPNTSGSEASGNSFAPTPTGFITSGTSATEIYIAIRRGPMKVPTTGTSVFGLNARTGTSANATVTGGAGVTDLAIIRRRLNGTSDWVWTPRLTGTRYLSSNLTSAEIAANTAILQANPWDVMDGVKVGTGSAGGLITNRSGESYINYLIDRAPGFFDVVCYTGDSSGTKAISHNLGVAPELYIVKGRTGSPTYGWYVYSAALGNTKSLVLNTTAAEATTIWTWGNTSPTASAFYVTSDDTVGGAGRTYVAYLFASCPGVSKVFNYTGNGSSQTINCGFTGGARFVLIKRTDSTGDWYVWDSARGIVSGNDPRLSLNSTAAEVTTDDSVDTDSTGFVVNQLSATNINVSSATYIGIAIA